MVSHTVCPPTACRPSPGWNVGSMRTGTGRLFPGPRIGPRQVFSKCVSSGRANHITPQAGSVSLCTWTAEHGRQGPLRISGQMYFCDFSECRV